MEGGCYAKINSLSKEIEPEVYNSIQFGTLVENAGFYRGTREINFNDLTITSNARSCFPLEYLPQAEIPAIGPHPKNVIFLTCDTKGVLPPVARLTKEQAVYQFLSGYASKPANGQDMNAKVPISTFSACFAEASLPLHPVSYAKMFYDKIQKHECNVWLVNTG